MEDDIDALFDGDPNMENEAGTQVPVDVQVDCTGSRIESLLRMNEEHKEMLCLNCKRPMLL